MTVEDCVIVFADAERLVRAVVPPTAPVNVVVPVPPEIVKACAPLTVVLKVIAPADELLEIVLVPVKLTATGNVSVLAPLTVILAPTEMLAALVNERFVKGVLPPTAPAKETTPAVPARKVKARAPLIVLADVRKLILAPAAVPPALVVSIVGLAFKVIGPVMLTTPPDVVMPPPDPPVPKLIAVDPE